jgi:hypothetical protein
LYLHELTSVSNSGLKHLSALTSLELLDIWTVPQLTDATVDVIASLSHLKELSIRATGVTDNRHAQPTAASPGACRTSMSQLPRPIEPHQLAPLEYRDVQPAEASTTSSPSPFGGEGASRHHGDGSNIGD